MNIETIIDNLIPYIDQPFWKPHGGRDFEWNVPIHEAGHAIVARVVQARHSTPYVFVEQDTNAIYGYASHRQIQPEETRENFGTNTRGVIPHYPGLERTLIKTCAVLLAGLAAECIAAGAGKRYALSERRIALEGQDALDAAAYCELVAGWNFQRVALPAWALAMRILKAKWAEVEALAAGIVPVDPPPHIRRYFRAMAAA